MSLLQRFVRIPPGTLACLYLGAIPIFAIFYSVLARQFYQSNALADAEAHRLRQQLTAQVKALVVDVYEYPQREGFGYSLRSLQVTSLRSDDADLTFETSFVRGLPRSHVTLAHRLRWYLGLPGDTNTSKQLPTRIVGIPEFLRGAFIRQREPNIGTELQWGPLRGSFGTADSSVFEGYIVAPDSTYALARRFQSATLGESASLDGKFWRFLYFSAVTITTVGFGDIVPSTDLARLLVASEAVFGVVVIGLFINSVSQGGSRMSSPDDR